MLEPTEGRYEPVEQGLDPLSIPLPDPEVNEDSCLHDYSLCGFSVSENAGPRLTYSGNL